MVIDANATEVASDNYETGSRWAATIASMLGSVLAAALASALTSSFIGAFFLWLLFWFLFGLLSIVVLGYVMVKESQWLETFGAWINSKF